MHSNNWDDLDQPDINWTDVFQDNNLDHYIHE